MDDLKVTQPANDLTTPNLPGEEWRDITDPRVRQAVFMVSNLGRVRNKLTGVIRKQFVCNEGYLKVSLMTPKNQVFVTALVHRLVALAFLPRIEGKPFVDHIDGNKLNNCVDNLRWCTYEENNRNPVTLAKGHQAQIAYYATPAGQKNIEHVRRCSIDFLAVPVRCLFTGLVYPSLREAATRTNRCRTAVKLSCQRAAQGIKHAVKGISYEYFTAVPSRELHE